jgi:hypothetical protein
MKIEYDKSILEYVLHGTCVLEYNDWSYKHRDEVCDDEYCDNEDCDNEDVRKIMTLPY